MDWFLNACVGSLFYIVDMIMFESKLFKLLKTNYITFSTRLTLDSIKQIKKTTKRIQKPLNEYKNH